MSNAGGGAGGRGTAGGGGAGGRGTAGGGGGGGRGTAGWSDGVYGVVSVALPPSSQGLPGRLESRLYWLKVSFGSRLRVV